ncbi:MAG: hypothetical protein WCB44_13570 [Stellaceae bacterium]
MGASHRACPADQRHTGSPGATITIDGKQLPPPDPKFGGVIEERASESTPCGPPAMADEAIQYMKQLREIARDKPFFVYYVPGGTRAPHNPTPEWIKKISDMHLFDGGWNKLRETIFA